MEKLTHWKKLTNPDYLGAYSLDDGEDVILTIKEVKNEMVTGSDGKKEEVVVIYFDEEKKPMIANVTNLKMIAKLAGTNYVQLWSGIKIQIGIEKVKAFGNITDALRVRDELPSDELLVCEDCGKTITASAGMSASNVAKVTLKKYGKKLCAECGKRHKEELNAAN